MTEVSQDKVAKPVRDMFNKGFSALERGNLDYAIDLLFSCVQMEPRFLQARRFLRAAEIQRYKQSKGGFLSKATGAVKGLSRFGHAMALLQTGKADQALASAEELLKADPLNIKYMKLLAKAAEQADLSEAALQTLEIAHEHYPDDDGVVEWVGDLYQKAKRTQDARRMYEKLCELRPQDLAALKKLKDATAIESMATDGWTETAQKKGTYREMMKDTKEAVLLEQESKAVKSDKDADALIAETRAKMEAEPENVNYYRALARLYAQRKQFDEGLETLRKALEISPGDPELDAALSGMRLQQFEHEIARLREAGDGEGAAAKEVERNQFYADNLQERVSRYPNDLKLRFELGVLYFDNGMLNEAIQQFQLSQRSAKHRIRSLYHLGLCFKRKEQYDLAVEQFQKASTEIIGMDDTKKDVLYEMGVVYERLGKTKEAGDAYKQIYQVDIGYKDIAQRVENVYRK